MRQEGSYSSEQAWGLAHICTGLPVIALFPPRNSVRLCCRQSGPWAGGTWAVLTPWKLKAAFLLFCSCPDAGAFVVSSKHFPLRLSYSDLCPLCGGWGWGAPGAPAQIRDKTDGWALTKVSMWSSELVQTAEVWVLEASPPPESKPEKGRLVTGLGSSHTDTETLAVGVSISVSRDGREPVRSESSRGDWKRPLAACACLLAGDSVPYTVA